MPFQPCPSQKVTAFRASDIQGRADCSVRLHTMRVNLTSGTRISKHAKSNFLHFSRFDSKTCYEPVLRRAAGGSLTHIVYYIYRHRKDHWRHRSNIQEVLCH